MTITGTGITTLLNTGALLLEDTFALVGFAYVCGLLMDRFLPLRWTQPPESAWRSDVITEQHEQAITAAVKGDRHGDASRVLAPAARSRVGVEAGARAEVRRVHGLLGDKPGMGGRQ